MIRHLVLWNFSDQFTQAEKLEHAGKIKRELENLEEVIDGLLAIQVEIEPMSGSSCDVLLDSMFKDEEALNHYQNHPEHQRIATFIKSVMKGRVCFDYAVNG